MRVAIMNKFYFILLIICFLGCSEESIPQDLTSSNSHPLESNSIPRNPLKNVYFGDTHVHTDLSFDAFLFGTRKTPDDAYYFGKGQKVKHAYGFNMQIKKPLDFMAVSDHAYYLGVLRHLSKSTSGDHTKFSKLLQGTKTADDVFEYTLSTPYDISTAVFVHSFSLNEDSSSRPFGVKFNNDGSKMFIAGRAEKKV